MPTLGNRDHGFRSRAHWNAADVPLFCSVKLTSYSRWAIVSRASRGRIDEPPHATFLLMPTVQA